MSGNVHSLATRAPTKAQVNSAWLAFQSLQLEAIEDPKKLLDRDFFERLTRAEAEFKRLFNAMDRQ
jgi:hypothetical protein